MTTPADKLGIFLLGIDCDSIKELLYTVLNNVNENHRDLQRRIADLEFQLERKASDAMERNTPRR